MDLTLRNPEPRPQTIVLERVQPNDKGFSIDGTSWTIPGSSQIILPIVWRPTELGKCLVKLHFKVDRHRLVVNVRGEGVDHIRTHKAPVKALKRADPRAKKPVPALRTQASSGATDVVPAVPAPTESLVRGLNDSNSCLFGGNVDFSFAVVHADQQPGPTPQKQAEASAIPARPLIDRLPIVKLLTTDPRDPVPAPSRAATVAEFDAGWIAKVEHCFTALLNHLFAPTDDAPAELDFRLKDLSQSLVCRTTDWPGRRFLLNPSTPVSLLASKPK